MGIEIVKKDLEGNLVSVRQAVASADVVIVSVHAHQQGKWLTDFAHATIDAGADIFFVHGPHKILGVEIYRNRPIFYSMGDFVFQNEQIDLLPSEFYERYGLGDEATPEDAQNARSAGGTRGFPAKREAWESFAATIRFNDGEVTEIRLLPLDLRFGKPLPIRGKPRHADKELGRSIISRTVKQSQKYDTDIRYVEAGNFGIVNVRVDR